MTPAMVDLDRDGFIVVPGVFSASEVQAILSAWSAALGRADEDEGPLRSRAGGLYGARNVASLWPDVVDVWRRPTLVEALAATLGPEFGLVRVLFFDKPPEQSWSLPWHKDLTIAVRDNTLLSSQFCKPTTKAGVPHVEAPAELLERMLTARIHLDEVTGENGPLQVIPGSHRSGKSPLSGATQRGRELSSAECSKMSKMFGDDDSRPLSPQSILCAAGDVLLMRPLLAHCSGHSQPDTVRHRRILHLEFAADPRVPDGYEWHLFVPA